MGFAVAQDLHAQDVPVVGNGRRVSDELVLAHNLVQQDPAKRNIPLCRPPYSRLVRTLGNAGYLLDLAELRRVQRHGKGRKTLRLRDQSVLRFRN